MISHEHPRFCDPDYDPFPAAFGGVAVESERPIYCTGCHDTEVEAEGQVCQSCLDSTQEDWVSVIDYLLMRVAAVTFAPKGRG